MFVLFVFILGIGNTYKVRLEKRKPVMSEMIVFVSLVLLRGILRLLPSNGNNNNVLDCVQTDYLTRKGSIV